MKHSILGALLCAFTLTAAAESVIVTGNATQRIDIGAGSTLNNLLPAGSNATARQSLATNRGDVQLSGVSVQEVYVTGGTMTNIASAESAHAEQSLSTNQGEVRLGGNTTQTVLIGQGAVLYNHAGAPGGRAIQELSTNSGCTLCK